MHLGAYLGLLCYPIFLAFLLCIYRKTTKMNLKIHLFEENIRNSAASYQWSLPVHLTNLNRINTQCHSNITDHENSVYEDFAVCVSARRYNRIKYALLPLPHPNSFYRNHFGENLYVRIPVRYMYKKPFRYSSEGLQNSK